ncbi:hypothetical protein CHS0354_007343 [Potamilus streckersoni]|uniref:MYND-type domain-containing protein n=1 Tax=Potamilus streckersoni TaxID=2493646 RepID=A0AAE0WBV3_9BIVA|nr:hypothetical protein CHS0354_007343 [Potamilus streckersoni]
MSASGKTKRKKDSSETKLKWEQLQIYHHVPETELQILVMAAAELEGYADLKDYLQFLTEKDPDKLHERDSMGVTALHCAVACKNLPTVILLLRYGLDVNAQDLLGFSPIFFATGRYPDVDIASYLIESGKASIDLRSKTGATPLHGAALQGNTDCIKLLLKHGADPRIQDEDGTMSFDLAEDDNTLLLLHEALIEVDSNKDDVDAICAQCQQIPKTGLKRCAQCLVTPYCSRECQIKHWKAGGHKKSCTGYVLARSGMCENEPDGVHMSLYHVLGSRSRNVKLFARKTNEAPKKMEFLRSKKFIVKVQVPLGNSSGSMMVYNVDRTVEGFINPSEKGYNLVASRIHTEGYMGIKAFFWAKLTDKTDGTFKVFHGKLAPSQSW